MCIFIVNHLWWYFNFVTPVPPHAVMESLILIRAGCAAARVAFMCANEANYI
jgi:hypothetical protein